MASNSTAKSTNRSPPINSLACKCLSKSASRHSTECVPCFRNSLFSSEQQIQPHQRPGSSPTASNLSPDKPGSSQTQASDAGVPRVLALRLSAPAEPRPLPNRFIESVAVMPGNVLHALVAELAGTRRRSGPPKATGRSPSFIPRSGGSADAGHRPYRCCPTSRARSRSRRHSAPAAAVPASCSTSDSGVPIHSAIYDQPSSHATSVIWLRTGKLFRSASESDIGLRDHAIHRQPPMSENPPA